MSCQECQSEDKPRIHEPERQKNRQQLRSQSASASQHDAAPAEAVSDGLTKSVHRLNL